MLQQVIYDWSGSHPFSVAGLDIIHKVMETQVHLQNLHKAGNSRSTTSISCMCYMSKSQICASNRRLRVRHVKSKRACMKSICEACLQVSGVQNSSRSPDFKKMVRILLLQWMCFQYDGSFCSRVQGAASGMRLLGLLKFHSLCNFLGIAGIPPMQLSRSSLFDSIHRLSSCRRARDGGVII